MLDKARILSLVTHRFLELIILPTEQCNFRCTYCYEDFSLGKMKRNTIEAIKKLITQRIPTLQTLKISWFGGEPLAAKDIVYEISEHIMKARKLYPHLHYIGGMTTNAFQLKETILRQLVSLGITDFQVSLDGTEEVHNKTRKRINGAGSFQEVWRNLLAARDSDLDFSMMLRIHVTPENVLDLYNLVEQIKFSFGYDERFSVFFKAIENLGGKQAGTFKVLFGKEKGEILGKLYQLLDGTLKIKKLTDHGPYVCYAAQANSFLIRADGKIGKCTVAFSDDRNSIGELRDDGTLRISGDKFALWTRGIKSLDKDELSCPMHKMPKMDLALKSIPVVVQ